MAARAPPCIASMWRAARLPTARGAPGRRTPTSPGRAAPLRWGSRSAARWTTRCIRRCATAAASRMRCRSRTAPTRWCCTWRRSGSPVRGSGCSMWRPRAVWWSTIWTSGRKRGQFAALTKALQTTVADGVLNLAFTSVVNNANVAAIEVLTTGGGGPSCALSANPTLLNFSSAVSGTYGNSGFGCYLPGTVQPDGSGLMLNPAASHLVVTSSDGDLYQSINTQQNALAIRVANTGTYAVRARIKGSICFHRSLSVGRRVPGAQHRQLCQVRRRAWRQRAATRIRRRDRSGQQSWCARCRIQSE